MLPLDIKGIAKVSQVLGHHLTLYHHIINIDFDAFAQLCLEHPQNHPLISGPYVLQAKQHYLVVVVPNRCHKGCFLMILQGKWYLIIALKGIQETYPRMARCCIHKLVCPGYGERVFWACFV